ncbi:DUF3788 domain-containing protein [Acetivibrio cellulolyticus]|uniref:DUF3788 domain-containing protein n=1 Tax=Acetivibrio cellulolyticus TaxID=35830 RepID=UPI0001E2F654|nr:DUF3788 domain-containing protein [Acetivibrio cellulolyticus]
MKLHELFDADHIPSFEDIRAYIGYAKPIWDELLSYIEQTYKAKPQLDYSKCSAQPGWNLKYKKNSKSLCTLYPMPNYFIALVVVGAKEENEVELAIEAGMFSAYVKELYQNTAFSAMGRWLMIEVKHKETLNDIKGLIEIRVKSK